MEFMVLDAMLLLNQARMLHVHVDVMLEDMMCLMLLQDLSLFVNEVKRDNEMLHSLSMVEKRYVVLLVLNWKSLSTQMTYA